MKAIELTKEERGIVLGELNYIFDHIADEDIGSFDFDIEIDDTLTINAKGWLHTDGYIEDDYHCGYMNGTGAYIETYREASLELTARVYDEDANILAECGVGAFEQDAERYLSKR